MKEIPITNRIPESNVAIAAAGNSNRKILEAYGGLRRAKRTMTQITEADLKSNKIIKARLQQIDHVIL